jgi:hypothetical protein
MNIDHLIPGRAGPAIIRRPLIRSIAALAVLSLSPVANAQTVLPQDVISSCAVSTAEFNLWFESGSVGVNGGVFPADGLAFSPNSLCSFYKWSQQMFLWVTSPVTPRYGSGSHVFNSPVFYAVSPPDPNNNNIRTLIPHSSGGLIGFNSNITQRGSQGQEVVFDDGGKIHDAVRPQLSASGNLLMRDKAGRAVEIKRIQAAPSGKPIFLDEKGKPVEVQLEGNAGARLRTPSGAILTLRPSTVLVNGTPHLVTTSGSVVQTEQGQAGGNVLMAQNGSLVYYLLQVNNVFAYFKTGVAKGSNGGIPNPFTGAFTQFPRNALDLAQVTNFALAHSAALADSTALTCELKSSWIETAGLNVADYVTINAIIPTFNPPLTPPFTQTGLTQSVPALTKQAMLALVGMHVVCTVLGHPEFIWASFEHVNNAPNAPYTYTSTSGVKPGPAPGPGPWLFSATGASSGPITPRMSVDPVTGNIDALTTQTIGRSDVYRKNAWGTASTDPGFTSNNTDIVSINDSAFGKLLPGDKRKQYRLIGAVWTNGQAPTATNQLGTTRVANATIESFFQPSSCFDCHKGNMLGVQPSGAFGGGLSHIWFQLKPLFP